jgi:hypothetical protein
VLRVLYYNDADAGFAREPTVQEIKEDMEEACHTQEKSERLDGVCVKKRAEKKKKDDEP